MPLALKIVLTVLLSLVALFCLIAIIGAFSLDENETINTGKLVGVIAAEIASIAGIWAIWRNRAPAA